MSGRLAALEVGRTLAAQSALHLVLPSKPFPLLWPHPQRAGGWGRRRRVFANTLNALEVERVASFKAGARVEGAFGIPAGAVGAAFDEYRSALIAFARRSDAGLEAEDHMGFGFDLAGLAARISAGLGDYRAKRRRTAT